MRGKAIFIIFIISLLFLFSGFSFGVGFNKIQEPVYTNPLSVSNLIVVSPPLKPVPGIQVKKEDLPIKIDIPKTSFLQVWLDRQPGAVYMPGEEMAIYFRVAKDSYVELYDISPDGKARLVFPNMYIRNNFLKAGNVYAIPIPGWFKIRVTPPLGKEYIQGFASISSNLLSTKEKRLIKTGMIPVLDVRVLTRKFNLLLDPIPKERWSSAVYYFNVGIPQNMPIAKPKVISQVPNVKVQAVAPVPKTSINVIVTPSSQTDNENFTEIPPPLGGLSISSIPEGATVYVDGVKKGITPIVLENVKVGSHTVKLKLTDYEILKQNVYVPNTKIATLVLSLIPINKKGYIFIVDGERDAKVYIDGKYIGKIPGSGNMRIGLKPGYHDITLMKKGFNTWSRGVNVTATETIYIFPNS